MNTGLAYAKTLLDLGLDNVVKVAHYKLLLKSGWYAWRYPASTWSEDLENTGFVIADDIDENISITSFPSLECSLFQKHLVTLTNSGDWFKNHLNGELLASTDSHWSKLPDFNPSFGDIKCLWDISRFDFLLKHCGQYARDQDEGALGAINYWLIDWCKKNQPNTGPNWKCAQECSIRTMHFIMAMDIIEKHKSNITVRISKANVAEFIIQHIYRIIYTTQYAEGQQNNHATSEAAALYSAGLYLCTSEHSLEHQSIGLRAKNKGLALMERSVSRLIDTDGTFSQYSVVYHRMLLDTLCYTEIVRKRFKQPAFSDTFYINVKKSSLWLKAMLIEPEGQAPNIGANDGTQLFNASSMHYRDFSATTNMAYHLFVEPTRFTDQTHPLMDIYKQYLELDQRESITKPQVCTDLINRKFDRYLVIERENGKAIMHVPRFSFRPSHCDNLHLDLWHKGLNIAKDGGSYSYADNEGKHGYYTGIRSHNTVEFDGRDSMFRISRFLFAKWIKADSDSVTMNSNQMVATCTDFNGATHQRSVANVNQGWRIKDTLSGNFETAILRWRLPQDVELVAAHSLVGSSFMLEVSTSNNQNSFNSELVKGYESLHYLSETQIKVLEVTVDKPCVLTTTIKLN